MAEMITDPTVYANQAAIRHDIGLAEANIRDKVGSAEARLEKAVGDNRYTIANEAGALSKQIGAEACGINREIANARQEQAENFGHTRRDILSTAGDIRRDVAKEAHDLSNQIGDGFCETDSKVLETGSSIRREAAEHTNEIVKEGLKGDFNTRGDIKDARYDLVNRIGDSADRVVDRLQEHDAKVADRFFTVGRDLMDLRQGQATLAKDVELQALKTQLDAKENTRYLNDKITLDGEKTRALINDLKYHDLNRGLVERNTELVNCEQDRRHWHDRYHDSRFDQIQAGFQGQWAQLQSQIQAFQSQLQETRQGMVNFGTMAGVGQSSTSNNVR